MTYYRFWPSGEVLIKTCLAPSPRRDVPTAAEADDFGSNVGIVGRYSVVGSALTIAMIGNDESGPHWLIERGTVNADGSLAINTRGPTLAAKAQVVEGLRRFPDW